MAGAHGSEGTEGQCRLNEAIIAYGYRMSRITSSGLDTERYHEGATS